MENAHTLSPTYLSDLRELVKDAFGEIHPIPGNAVPGGTISERLRAPFDSDGPLLVWGSSAVNGEATEVKAGQYWALALPRRLIVLAPLLELARAELTDADRREAEKAVLEVYADLYGYVPLPPRVLQLIKRQCRVAPWEGVPEWLDDAAAQTMSAATLDAAIAVRKRLRLDALRRGVSRAWGDESVSVAELMTDILVICRAAREDVQLAHAEAKHHSGSIALALGVMDEAGGMAFERALVLMARPSATVEDLEPEERSPAIEFAKQRVRIWERGLFAEREIPARPPVAVVRSAVESAGTRSVPDKPVEPTETASEIYLRLRTGLEEKIVAAPHVHRQLALLGTAHVQGVTRLRLLITGPSGSGKTHSARVLAQLLDRPFLQVDMSDVTGTGWRGAEINELLSTLADSAGGSLAGAVIFLDEIDKIRVEPNAEGNSREAKYNLQTSLLPLLDGNPVTPESSRHGQLDTDRLLVIGSGAFDNQFADRPPATQDLCRWGFLEEHAARWRERLSLTRPGRYEAMELLRRSDQSVEQRLGPLITALEMQVLVPDEVLGYVVDVWVRVGADFRTASEWVLAAVRNRLISALERGDKEPIILTPDDISTGVR